MNRQRVVGGQAVQGEASRREAGEWQCAPIQLSPVDLRPAELDERIRARPLAMEANRRVGFKGLRTGREIEADAVVKVREERRARPSLLTRQVVMNRLSR